MPAAAGAAATRVKLYSGPERGVQSLMARDMARMFTRDPDIQVLVTPTVGTADTLFRLRDESGPQLGFVTSDVAAAYSDAAARGFADATPLIASLRVLASLYDEHFHFIVRSDSEFKSVADIRNARINVGPFKGSTALSFAHFYKTIFGASLNAESTSVLAHDEALAKLVTDRSIDVVVILAEQPARLLAEMKPEARQYVRVLRMGKAVTETPGLLTAYRPARLLAANYPSLLDEDIDGFAVRVLLVTDDRTPAEHDPLLAAIARTLCQNLPRIQGEGQSQWRQVKMELPDLGAGWNIVAPAVRKEIAACAADLAGDKVPPACGAGERILGVCR